MKKQILANGLRERLRKKSLVSETTLSTVSDDDIIESYTICSRCKKVWVKKEALGMMISEAMTTDEFIMMSSPEGCC